MSQKTSAIGRNAGVTDKAEFATGLSVDEARARIVQVGAKRALPNEKVTLEAAVGRILRADIHAPHDVPAFINSAMDGFAVRAVDLPTSGEKTFRLIGQ